MAWSPTTGARYSPAAPAGTGQPTEEKKDPADATGEVPDRGEVSAMTTTLPAPTVEVERASREHVAALMLKAVRDHGLTWPRYIAHLEDQPSGDLLDIAVDGRAVWLGWVDFFGEPEYRAGLVVHMPWCGWTVLLSYREAPALDAETAALIDEVTAEPAFPDVPWTANPVACACEVVHPLGCPGDEAPVDWNAVGRANILAALSAGPRILSAHPHEAVKAALRDGAIVTDHVSGTGRVVYALAPSRVDVEAAAQIPVTVVELTLCPATYYGAPCTGNAIYDDGRCSTHTTCVTAEQVGVHFTDEWANLNILQRARLIEACQLIGWDADWTAAYQQVTSDTALWSEDQTATAVDELMADEGDVDHAQLAEALTIDPDAEIAYEIAHRHDGPQIVEHVTIDPDLIVDGRGGAGAARIGKPIDLTRGTVEGITGGAK